MSSLCDACEGINRGEILCKVKRRKENIGSRLKILVVENDKGSASPESIAYSTGVCTTMFGGAVPPPKSPEYYLM